MTDQHPKHIIAVLAVVSNEAGEILLVKTHWRSDTWEPPGGQVEEGEALDKAAAREVLEETGIKVKPLGITGVYYNETSKILSVIFKAELVSGEINIQPEEIKEAAFIKITTENMDDYITRPNVKSKTLDAMRAKNFVPYETWKVRPYNLLGRLDN